MAKVQNPLIGRASGKFAGAVFSTLYGQNIVRSMPVSTPVSQSDAAKLVRQKFAAVSEPIKAGLPFWNDVYGDVSLNMPVYSHLVGYAFRNAASGEVDDVEIDYSKLSPAGDSMNIGSSLSIEKDVEDQVTVDFSAAGLASKIGADGEIVAMAINTESGAVTYQLTPVAPAAGEIVIPFDGDPDGISIQIFLAAKKKITKFKPGSELTPAV